jgi:hypothetical protein
VTTLRRFLAGPALGLLTMLAPAAAGEVALTFAPLPPVLPGVAAFPHVTAADNAPQAVRIDQALRRADARVRAAAARCRPEGKGPPNWTRTIAVTMRGPRVLSLLADDAWFCGAYPDTSRLALVYDLETGAPIDWARVLPRALVESTTVETAGDGSVLGLVKSTALNALYRRALSEDCREVLSDDDLAFQLWPDAKAGGLIMRTMVLPHAVAACAESVTVPTAALRGMGVRPELLDAIDSAHRDGRFE